MSYSKTSVTELADGSSMFEIAVMDAETVYAAKAERERLMNDLLRGKPHRVTAELSSDAPDNRAYVRFNVG